MICGFDGKILKLTDNNDKIANILITVYGPCWSAWISIVCIHELSEVRDKVLLPMLISGDFNLIREVKNKSSDLCSEHMIYLFNGFIGSFS